MHARAICVHTRARVAASVRAVHLPRVICTPVYDAD
jgi:hypothetical protein